MFDSQPAVDQKAGIVRGLVVAQSHAFRTPGRGRFTIRSLERIVELSKRHREGLPCRFQHPGGNDDGLGSWLGRIHDLRMSNATWREDDGRQVTTDAVRGDLHLSKTSFRSPRGNLGGHLLDRLESDPASMGTSLVLESDLAFEFDASGRRIKTGPDGKPLPPIWTPTVLHACDAVASGDAVSAALSPVDSLHALADRLRRIDKWQGRLNPRRNVNYYYKEAERRREYDRRCRILAAYELEGRCRPLTDAERAARHAGKLARLDACEGGYGGKS